MITELYTFSPSSYVVAEEWNANFRVLYSANVLHQEAIVDANSKILFIGGDYSGIYSRLDNIPNSKFTDSVLQNPLVDYEYYTTIQSGGQLFIQVDRGSLNGEARVLVKIQESSQLPPVIVTYGGTQDDVVWTGGLEQWYSAGMRFIFLLERDGKLYVKMIATE